MATSARTRRARQKDWRPAFLKHLAIDGDVSGAAKAVGIGRRTAYDHCESEPEFKAAWDEALEMCLDRLEKELIRRGVTGWDEPVFYQGKRTAKVRKFSDVLLLARLNARGKARGYGRQSVEVNLQIEESRADAHRRIDASGLSADQKAAAHAEVDKASTEGA